MEAAWPARLLVKDFAIDQPASLTTCVHLNTICCARSDTEVRTQTRVVVKLFVNAPDLFTRAC